MLNSDLTILIQKLYGFASQVLIVKKVTDGYLSENHIIMTGRTKYFLKKYRFSERERIEEIHRAKAFFSEKGIPVILPISAQEGPFFEWKGHFYTLFPFVEGNKYRRLELTAKALEETALLLARIHTFGKTAPSEIVKERLVTWNKKDFLLRASNLLVLIDGKETRSDFDIMAKRLLQEKIILAENLSTRYEDFQLGPEHLVHGDFHEQNIFFDNTDHVLAIFDWEKANFMPREIELARVLEFFCFYGNYKEENFTKAGVFLKAYQSVYPISKKILANGIRVWNLNQIHSLWVLEEHYLQNNTKVDDFLNSQINFLEYHKVYDEDYIKYLTKSE